MNAAPRFWEIFFELFEELPRQGPGNRACAVRALSLCRDLPQEPMVLDLGCGTGGQTLYLADLTSGPIVAIDNHRPFIERLGRTLAERGLLPRVRAVVADMADPGQWPGDLDLIWSEGALYSIGLDRALRNCCARLRPGGYLAFTDAVWRKEDPPPEIKASFELDYPAMGRVEDVLAAIERIGLERQGHFTLPDEAWWEEFYTPMTRRIDSLRIQYAGDREASMYVAQLAREPELHRQYSDFYAYEFFVARRP